MCNNSGGALVERGPAYTQYALFAQVDANGRIQLRNHLGLRLGEDPEEVLSALEAGRFSEADVLPDDRQASAQDYAALVRDVDAPSPARFNADPARLFEASGSAGKVMVFAVRLDTFPTPGRSTTFYVGSNETAEFGELRRRMLRECEHLPISAEYIHREAFDLAHRYGRDTVFAIRLLGTARLPLLARLKALLDRVGARVPLLPPNLSDRLLQGVSRLIPEQLPPRMRRYRDRFEHHLILKVGESATPQVRSLLSEMLPSSSGAFFECSGVEAERAFLHRFAVAGAAVRYRAVHVTEVEDIVALDIALRRDDRDWFERLSPEIADKLIGKLYYGHFFCHVFHQDYLVRKGVAPLALEHQLLGLTARRGAEFPAEHNVGHLYCAKPELVAHYHRLDPANCLNPGIGQTSRKRDWK